MVLMYPTVLLELSFMAFLWDQSYECNAQYMHDWIAIHTFLVDLHVVVHLSLLSTLPKL